MLSDVDSSASNCTLCNKNKTSHEYFFLVSGTQGNVQQLCPTNYYYVRRPNNSILL